MPELQTSAQTINDIMSNLSLKLGLIDISKNNSNLVIQRCYKLIDFVNTLEIGPDDVFIIEKQSQNNIVAMEIMYSLTAIVLTKTKNLILFDPKLKFTSINEKYETKGLRHKRKSIEMAQNALKFFPDSETVFESFDKKDDIADALNQGLIHLGMTTKINMNEFKQIFGYSSE
jgi:hypothetical protein